MKIDSIVISNYKAFYGTHRFDIGGKNCLIYGENGSGKSSFYYALKDFFKAATLDGAEAAKHKDLLNSEVKNLFAIEFGKASGGLTVQFKGKGGDPKFDWTVTESHFDFEESRKEIGIWPKSKPYYNGKKVLSFSGEGFDVWGHIVKRFFLEFSKERESKTFGTIFKELEAGLNLYSGSKRRADKKRLLEALFVVLDSIVAHLNQSIPLFLKKFDETIEVEVVSNFPRHWLEPNANRYPIDFLKTSNADNFDKEYVEDIDAWAKDWIILKIKYFGRQVTTDPQLFLNEARRSAICLSAMFASLKRPAVPPPYKFLILDDVLVGMDNSLRLPMIDILETEFSDCQSFVLTYDRSWYEMNKRMLGDSWSYLEMYKDTVDDLNIPNVLVQSPNSPLGEAIAFKTEKRYSMAAHRLRIQFEELLKDKKLPHIFREGKSLKGNVSLRGNTLGSLLKGLEDWANSFPGYTEGIQNTSKLKGLLSVLMNPSSHADSSHPFYLSELDLLVRLEKWLRDSLASASERRLVKVEALVRLKIPSITPKKFYVYEGELVEPFLERTWNGYKVKVESSINCSSTFVEMDGNPQTISPFNSKYKNFREWKFKVSDHINKKASEGKFDGPGHIEIKNEGDGHITMIDYKDDGGNWKPITDFYSATTFTVTTP